MSVTQSREVERRAGLPSNFLDKECTIQHILKIYRLIPYTIFKESLPEHLGLTRPQQSSLLSVYGGDAEKSLALLKMWKQSQAFKAKLRVLVDALIDMNEPALAINVCKAIRPPGKCISNTVR